MPGDPNLPLEASWIRHEDGIEVFFPGEFTPELIEKRRGEIQALLHSGEINPVAAGTAHFAIRCLAEINRLNRIIEHRRSLIP